MGKLEELAEKIHDPDTRAEFLSRVERMTDDERSEAEDIIPGMFAAVYAGKHLGPGNQPIDPPEPKIMADTLVEGRAATRRRKQMERRKNG